MSARIKRPINGSTDFSNDNVGRRVSVSTVEWPEAAVDDYADWLGAGEGLKDDDPRPHLPRQPVKIAA